jgi:hypothetical protein
MNEFNMTLVALMMASGFAALPLALILSPVIG